jgi:hypothetical protein
MSNEFRSWLDFHYRPEPDKYDRGLRLAIQFAPEATMTLNRDQALHLAEHIRAIALTLPTLEQRLGLTGVESCSSKMTPIQYGR